MQIALTNNSEALSAPRNREAISLLEHVQKRRSKGESMGDIGESFEAFVNTIIRLRLPDGCPWDREQTHDSIARNMVEEAYEAVDAIERKDMADLREELGDVLLQVVLQSQMASEEGAFTVKDVIEDVNEKMIRRHPHVFGDFSVLHSEQLMKNQTYRIESIETPEQVLELWEQIKLSEKQNKVTQSSIDGDEEILERKGAEKEKAFGLLDNIPKALPALMQAQDISRKAVSAGFEWDSVDSVWEQVFSEIEEYRAEETGSNNAAQEFGDVLFSLVNVARKEGIDAESALRLSCKKFRRRWAIMEGNAKLEGKTIPDYSINELERLWQDAKSVESV